jgi:hypothetical protein
MEFLYDCICYCNQKRIASTWRILAAAMLLVGLKVYTFNDCQARVTNSLESSPKSRRHSLHLARAPRASSAVDIQERMFIRQNIKIPHDDPTTNLSGFIIEDLRLQSPLKLLTGWYIRFHILSPSLEFDGDRLIQFIKPSRFVIAAFTISVHFTNIIKSTAAINQRMRLGLLLTHNRSQGTRWEVLPTNSIHIPMPMPSSTGLAFATTLPGIGVIALDIRKGLYEDRLVLRISIRVNDRPSLQRRRSFDI